MKKDSVFLWIVALMLMATGVSFSASSSHASDLDRQLGFCNVNRQPGDKVTGVRFHGYGGSENVVLFDVAAAVDATHLPGRDLVISVLPYDRNGNFLASSLAATRMPISSHIGFTSTGATLKSGASLSLVDSLLVRVEAGGPETFKFCDIFHNGNGAWVPYQPPNVPAIQPPNVPATQPPVLVSAEACLGLDQIGGSLTCIGIGGHSYGKAGSTFHRGDPIWILIKIRNLPRGHYVLVTRYSTSKDNYSKHYDGETINFTSDGSEICPVGFRARYNRDRYKDVGGFKVSIILDGNVLGEVFYSIDVPLFE